MADVNRRRREPAVSEVHTVELRPARYYASRRCIRRVPRRDDPFRRYRRISCNEIHYSADERARPRYSSVIPLAFVAYYIREREGGGRKVAGMMWKEERGGRTDKENNIGVLRIGLLLESNASHYRIVPVSVSRGFSPDI